VRKPRLGLHDPIALGVIPCCKGDSDAGDLLRFTTSIDSIGAHLVGIEYVDTAPDRRPSPKRFGPSVGIVVDPFRRALYGYESEPERAVLTVLASLPGVRRISVQRKVRYRFRGVARTYTFDIVVQWWSGWREAFAVKQSDNDLLDADDTLHVLKAISEQYGTRLADDYRVVTYDTLDPVAVMNGRVILRCGRDQDHAAMDVVRATLARLGPVVTLAEVAEQSCMGKRGLRAAVALIQSGLLMPPRGERLRVDLPLENRRPTTGSV
jgi:hypothetical protein